MWQKIDALANILPENNPPKQLADCFLRETPAVRTMSLIVGLAIGFVKLGLVMIVLIVVFQ